MTDRRAVLLMAGAREALEIATALAARAVPVRACLPEPSRLPPLPVPTEVRGFADDRDFDQWLDRQGAVRVIDAGHPFDTGLSLRAARVCDARGVAYLRLLRPEWRPERGDRWTPAATLDEAVRMVRPDARVFCNTGRGTAEAFARFPGEALFLRVMDRPSAPPAFGFMRYLPATPPFEVRGERSLLDELAITQLICRNTGGSESRAKLLAARDLGLEVIMIRRPDPPEGACVGTVAEAITWAVTQ